MTSDDQASGKTPLDEEQIHSLLRRQLKKISSDFLAQIRSNDSWVRLIRFLNEAYHQFDEDRESLERSLDLTSKELLAKNNALEEQLQSLKLAKTSLQVREAYLKSVLDSMFQAHIVTDRDNRILSWSKQAEKMYGWTLEEVERLPVFAVLFAPKYRRQYEIVCNRILVSEGETGTLDASLKISISEGICRNRLDESFPAEVVVAPLTHGGGIYFSFFVRDISQQVENEKLKDAFISNISHEMRTPLTVLSTAVDGLLEEVFGPLQDTQKRTLEVVKNHLNRFGHIIETLVDLSKYELNQITPQLERVALKDLVDPVVQAKLPVGSNLGVHLEVEVPDSPQSVEVDANMFKQLLMNLVDNALKHAKQRVKIQLVLDPEKLTVHVMDDGKGVDAKDKDKIFKKFRQADRPEGGGGYLGIGSGLAIVQKIVLLHGGTIECVPVSPHGADFVVTIPVVQSQDKRDLDRPERKAA
jgi:PAS domain S-box-containing protein